MMEISIVARYLQNYFDPKEYRERIQSILTMEEVASTELPLFDVSPKGQIRVYPNIVIQDCLSEWDTKSYQSSVLSADKLRNIRNTEELVQHTDISIAAFVDTFINTSAPEKVIEHLLQQSTKFKLIPLTSSSVGRKLYEEYKQFFSFNGHILRKHPTLSPFDFHLYSPNYKLVLVVDNTDKVLAIFTIAIGDKNTSEIAGIRYLVAWGLQHEISKFIGKRGSHRDQIKIAEFTMPGYKYGSRYFTPGPFTKFNNYFAHFNRSSLNFTISQDPTKMNCDIRSGCFVSEAFS